MTSPVDPNEVRLTGENSFLRLQQEKGGTQTTRVSHWRVLMSPGGPGHVLFLKSDVTADQVRIYADNIALARWLQEEIESMLFPEFADQTIPVIDSVFDRSGDAISYWTETVDSDEETITMTWYDFVEPIMIANPAGSTPERPHGVYTVLVPARRTQLTLNGLVAQGQTFPDMRGDRVSSTSCLAWSETWVRPR